MIVISADAIFKATTTDGVYSSDPKLDKNAIKYDKITFQEVIDNKLGIMDMEAMEICKDNNIKMTFSINPLIPKPHTPIQWFKYDLKSNKKKIKHMKKSLKGIDVKFDSARMGLIQYILSCGNSTVGKLIEKKALKGNVTIKEWENQIPTYKINDKLPWNNIKIPTDKDFLKEEYNKITNNQVTPWCEEEGCYNCGACTPKKMNNKE